MAKPRYMITALLLGNLACEGVEPLPLLDPTEVSYAPALGVDLAAMEELPSGVYILDIAAGRGPASVVGDTVEVDYTGWLPDGASFDTSEGRSTFSFTLGAGRVIRGWEVGVVGMRAGGERRLVIPSELGYGSRGAGSIPPNAVLVFEVKLHTIR